MDKHPETNQETQTRINRNAESSNPEYPETRNRPVDKHPETPSTGQRRIAELKALKDINDAERKELARLEEKEKEDARNNTKKDAERRHVYEKLAALNSDEWAALMDLLRQRVPHLFTDYPVGGTRYPGAAYRTPEESKRLADQQNEENRNNLTAEQRSRKTPLTADEERALRDSEKLGGVKHVR